MQFVFGDQRLDVERRELRRGAEAIAIEPQVFDLLVYLVRIATASSARTISSPSVWGGRIVSESTLTSRINAARKAVGDSGGEQRLIRTIARKGLRFIGDVRTEPNAAAAVRSRRIPGAAASRRARRCRCPTGPPSRCCPSST